MFGPVTCHLMVLFAGNEVQPQLMGSRSGPARNVSEMRTIGLVNLSHCCPLRDLNGTKDKTMKDQVIQVIQIQNDHCDKKNLHQYHANTPRQGHICTERHCCCCLPASSRCVWCLPLVGRGGTAALQPPQGARHRENPPGKSESEKSPWKTDEWSFPPSRHSSEGKERKPVDRQGRTSESFKSGR